jgi:hypothetical protein
MTLEDFRNVPIRTQDFSSVYPQCADLAGKVKRLEHAGDIIRLKRGLYAVSPKISRTLLSEGLIANHIYGPSYVSMQSALRYYGLIPEAVYRTTSMTTGTARSYENSIGIFQYTHSEPPYYNIGVVSAQEDGISYLIASPEKALCDQMIFTSRLNLRYLDETLRYLEEDLRLDMDQFYNFDIEILQQCASVCRKKAMINQLIKLIQHEQHL